MVKSNTITITVEGLSAVEQALQSAASLSDQAAQLETQIGPLQQQANALNAAVRNDLKALAADDLLNTAGPSSEARMNRAQVAADEAQLQSDQAALAVVESQLQPLVSQLQQVKYQLSQINVPAGTMYTYQFPDGSTVTTNTVPATYLALYPQAVLVS